MANTVFYMLSTYAIYLLYIVVLILPAARIIGRIGFSPFWILAAFVPVVNVIGLWFLAIADWPSVSEGEYNA